MDVSHFGLFNVTCHSPGPIEPPPDAPPVRIGPGRIANDNNHAAGPPRTGRRQRTLFRFLSHRFREPGPA